MFCLKAFEEGIQTAKPDGTATEFGVFSGS